MDLSLLLPAFLLLTWFGQNLSQSKSKVELISLSQTELSDLRNCFQSDIYGLRSLQVQNDQIICYGNLRPVNLRIAYKSVIEKVSNKFGDRFLVLFRQLPDKDSDQITAKPTFVLIPTPPFAKTGRSRLIGTLLSVILSAWLLVNLNQVYAVALIMLIIGRELVRYLVARRYRLRLSLPIFLPAELGSFGSLGWNLAAIPHRRALFDLAIAPTIFSILFSLLFIRLGMGMGEWGEELLLHFSFQGNLIPQISSWGWNFLQNYLTLTPKNPLILAGKTGLLITAVSLLPIQPLAGGYLIQAMFGRDRAEIVSKIMGLLLLAIALTTNPWLLWFMLFLFAIKPPMVSILDEVSDYGNWRDLASLTLFALSWAILLPK